MLRGFGNLGADIQPGVGGYWMSWLVIVSCLGVLITCYPHPISHFLFKVRIGCLGLGGVRIVVVRIWVVDFGCSWMRGGGGRGECRPTAEVVEDWFLPRLSYIFYNI